MFAPSVLVEHDAGIVYGSIFLNILFDCEILFPKLIRGDAFRRRAAFMSNIVLDQNMILLVQI